jgi:hypothetical protein
MLPLGKQQCIINFLLEGSLFIASPVSSISPISKHIGVYFHLLTLPYRMEHFGTTLALTILTYPTLEIYLSPTLESNNSLETTII